jgi:GalNAc-alpha-(1->4)-GalNAc-alpha-(1->3)-diNAcBac-PP-undecaprenol alpha-1,4-N-acetyl-D-galactosaminyltransferase
VKSNWQRLTIVIHSLFGGGSEHAAAAMANYWAEAGRDVVLVTLDSVENDQIALSPKVERIGLGVMSESSGIWSAIKANQWRIQTLREALVQSAPERVISLTDRTNILTLLAARGTNLKVFVSERTDIRHHRIERVWEWLRKRTYPGACSIVVQTEAVREVMKPIARHAPIRVIPNSVSTTATLPEKPTLDLPSEDRNWFIGVGRLSYEKGFDRLIDAFAQITEQCPDWNLLIIGDGPEKPNLQNTADKFGSTERITFPGWIESPWSVIPQAIPPTASIAILPSRYEGFPNALLEAMSQGIAPIAFDCESGPSEIIRHNENGLLVPQGNIPELAIAMQSLAQDNALRTRLADTARDVTNRFSLERIFALWEDVLSNCE